MLLIQKILLCFLLLSLLLSCKLRHQGSQIASAEQNLIKAYFPGVEFDWEFTARNPIEGDIGLAPILNPENINCAENIVRNMRLNSFDYRFPGISCVHRTEEMHEKISKACNLSLGKIEVFGTLQLNPSVGWSFHTTLYYFDQSRNLKILDPALADKSLNASHWLNLISRTPHPKQLYKVGFKKPKPDNYNLNLLMEKNYSQFITEVRSCFNNSDINCFDKLYAECTLRGRDLVKQNPHHAFAHLEFLAPRGNYECSPIIFYMGKSGSILRLSKPDNDLSPSRYCAIGKSCPKPPSLEEGKACARRRNVPNEIVGAAYCNDCKTVGCSDYSFDTNYNKLFFSEYNQRLRLLSDDDQLIFNNLHYYIDVEQKQSEPTHSF